MSDDEKTELLMHGGQILQSCLIEAHTRIMTLEAALREILRVLNEDENDDWRLDTVHRAQRALETKQ